MREGVPGADAPAGLARQLADALAARGLSVRDAPPPALVDEPDERAALAGASDAYTALRPGDARQQLDALFARTDARGSSGLDEAGHARALLLLSLAALALGDAAAADAALDRLLAADPTVVADAATYPPPLRARLESRRALVAALPLVSLEVVTAPGTVIELDGHALPDGQTERRVAPGPHLVRVRAPGHVPAGARVDASADPTQLALSLAPDPGAVLAASGRPRTPLGDELLAVARELEVSPLVVDVSRGQGGLVVDVRDAASAHRAHMVVPANIAARALALRITNALLAPTPGIPAVPRPPAQTRVWPWLVAAGVVVAGAVAVGVAVAVRDEPNTAVLVHVTP